MANQDADIHSPPDDEQPGDDEQHEQTAAAAAKPASARNGTHPPPMHTDLAAASKQLRPSPATPLPNKNRTQVGRVPLEHPQEPAFSFTAAQLNKFARFAGMAIALLIAMAVAAHIMNTKRSGLGAKPPMMFALTDRLPDRVCEPISLADIHNGTAFKGEIDLRSLLESLRYHLQENKKGERLQGVCAQHLQSWRACICIVNMSPAPGNYDYVEMYNMKVIGYTPDPELRRRVVESSTFCPGSTTESIRFDSIVIQYMDEQGVLVERAVRGSPAYTLQQCNEAQAARSTCAATNIEIMVNRLQRTIDDVAAGHILGKADQLPFFLPKTAQQDPHQLGAGSDTQQQHRRGT